jgi:hypothetical protein
VGVKRPLILLKVWAKQSRGSLLVPSFSSVVWQTHPISWGGYPMSGAPGRAMTGD